MDVCPAEALPLPLAKAVLFATPTLDDRPSLAYVQVICAGGTYTVTATDGHWLIQVTHTPMGDLARPNFADNIWMVPRDILVEYITSKGYAPLGAADDIDFPDTGSLVPAEGDGEGPGVVGLNTCILMDVTASAKALFGRPKTSFITMRWQFGGPLGPVRVDAVYPEKARMALDSAMWIIMPMRLD